MRLSITYSLFLSSFLSSLLLSPTFAIKKSYIVYLGSHSNDSEASLSDLKYVEHYALLESLTNSKENSGDKILYSYTKNINGFAAILEEEEAEELSKHPDVLSVFLNKGKHLHTTHSWNFLGLERHGAVPFESIWTKARFGEDAIIGNLDTGVWPESKSFGDEGIGPLPSKWRGICQNDTTGVRCNRKLIGARHFNKGYASFVGPLNSTFNTARDHSGHGTHTLSTAGGGFVAGANVFGNGNGTAKGGSPFARVAAYKVCWPPVNGSGECFDADIIAGFEAAISDGVDVLSVSLGAEPTEYSEDLIAIGAFHAVMKGTVVVASAGNSGPEPQTVSNTAPWIITVGASTIDREFTTYVALGSKRHLKGTSLSERGLPAEKFYPMITGEHAKNPNVSALEAMLCLPEALDPKKVKGKILVCLRGEIGRVNKGQQALLAGAVGMVLINDEKSGNEILADPHVLPAAHVNFSDGEAVLAYINSTKVPMAYMTRSRTQFDTKPAPVMAAFSSRGPSYVDPSILKPDITAPGVSIIAAFSLAVSPTEEDFDKRRIAFNTESGTSMSCPHVSGIVGLLKTLHPDWSPAAIRSALMTTARTRGNNMEPIIDSSTNKEATPFDYGAGHVNPNKAMDPGLIYDLTENDYLNFLCAKGYNKTQIRLFSSKPYSCPKSFKIADFNYPSITIPSLISLGGPVTRRVKNVGSGPSKYCANVKAPHGVSVLVEPKCLEFEKTGEEKIFKVALKSLVKNEVKDYVFGKLIWSDGKHYVRSPIVVRY
ncbi:hypothetical protein JCGZ_13182 [Jatropha curcas]|uniref:Uncharacterized protein n=1 Tax=Jatropha curcas TaxID=180498 RepID=A0A067K933_JATCU|nr:hypothetical protein JCGZ_13182 [Jatropha curcas]